MIETVITSIMLLKLPLYLSYNRVIQNIFNTVLIIEVVLIIETEEYFKNAFEFFEKYLLLNKGAEVAEVVEKAPAAAKEPKQKKVKAKKGDKAEEEMAE